MQLRSLTILILTMIGNLAFSQNLELFKGKDKKVFNKGSILNLLIVQNGVQPNTNLKTTVAGELLDVTTDSVILNIDYLNIVRTSDNQIIENKYQYKDISHRKAFSKNSLTSLKNFKTKKYDKSYKNRQIASALLLVTGLTTTLTSLFVKDKDNRKGILIAGVIQLGGSIGLGVIPDKKVYHLKDKNDLWSISK